MGFINKIVKFISSRSFFTKIIGIIILGNMVCVVTTYLILLGYLPIPSSSFYLNPNNILPAIGAISEFWLLLLFILGVLYFFMGIGRLIYEKKNKTVIMKRWHTGTMIIKGFAVISISFLFFFVLSLALSFTDGLGGPLKLPRINTSQNDSPLMTPMQSSPVVLPTKVPPIYVRENWKQYENRSYGYKIRYPKEWSTIISQNNNGSISDDYVETSGYNGSSDALWMTITVTNVTNEPKALTDFNTDYNTALGHTIQQYSNQKLVKDANILVANYPAVRYYFSQDNGNGTTNYDIVYETVKGNLLYKIDFSTFDHNTYITSQKLYEQIVATFQFTPELSILAVTPTLAPTIAPIEDWGEYENKTYGYTIRYPNEWTCTNPTINTTGGLDYADVTCNNGNKISGLDQIVLFISVLDLDGNKYPYDSNKYYTIYNTAPGKEIQAAAIQKEFKDANILIGNNAAEKYSTTQDNGNDLFNYDTVYETVKGNYLYKFDFTTLNKNVYSQSQALYDQMISTVQFTN